MRGKFILKVKFQEYGKVYDYYIDRTFLSDSLTQSLNSVKKFVDFKRGLSMTIMNYDGREVQVTPIAIGPPCMASCAGKEIEILDMRFAEFQINQTVESDLLWREYKKTKDYYTLSSSSGDTISNDGAIKAELKTNTKGDNNSMKNTFSQFGQKVNGIFAISLFDGSPAYKLNGTYVAVKDGGLVDVSEFVMEIDIPGFTMPSLLKDVKVNDLVKVNGELGIVSKVEDASLKVIKGDGSITEVAPIVNPLFGGAFVVKVMNPMAGMAGQGQGIGGFNPMMFMLMGDNKGDDMFKTMMMMQMMQGGGGMFGQPTVAPQAQTGFGTESK